MTVLSSKRRESETEFIHTARKLQIFTLRCCKKFPTRYWGYWLAYLIGPAASITSNVEHANSIYPLCQEEVKLRRSFFIKALGDITNLASQIEIVYEAETFQLEARIKTEWIALIDKEERLIKGVMKKDRERYKNIPD